MSFDAVKSYFYNTYFESLSNYKKCSHDTINNCFIVENEGECFDFDNIKNTKWRNIKSCDSLSFSKASEKVCFHEFKNSSYDRSKNNFIDKISGSFSIYNAIVKKVQPNHGNTKIYFVLVIPMNKPRDKATAAMINRSSSSYFAISSAKAIALKNTILTSNPTIKLSFVFTTSSRFDESLQLLD